jgi:hypothetical protein
VPTLEDPTSRGQGRSFLVIPTETAEYRIDVAPFSEPVRVRIVRDPREETLHARERAAPRAGYAALVVRAVTYAGDVRIGPGGPHTLTGGEACLAVPFGAIRFARFLGGCLFRVSELYHSDGRLLLFSIAPQALVLRRDRVEVGLAIDYGFGESDVEVPYTAWGLALPVGIRMSRRLTIEIEPGFAAVRHEEGDVFQGVETVSDNVPRLAAGLRVNL